MRFLPSPTAPTSRWPIFHQEPSSSCGGMKSLWFNLVKLSVTCLDPGVFLMFAFKVADLSPKNLFGNKAATDGTYQGVHMEVSN